MNIQPTQLDAKLHHVQFHHRAWSDVTGAVAGLASAIAVVFGWVAAYFAPHGVRGFAVALHLHRAPLIVRLAPLVAGIAALIATTAGLLRFYSWWRERREDARSAVRTTSDF
jgi:Zn-dependent protease with chaperone function